MVEKKKNINSHKFQVHSVDEFLLLGMGNQSFPKRLHY